jgi:hypothetical protein
MKMKMKWGIAIGRVYMKNCLLESLNDSIPILQKTFDSFLEAIQYVEYNLYCIDVTVFYVNNTDEIINSWQVRVTL